MGERKGSTYVSYKLQVFWCVDFLRDFFTGKLNFKRKCACFAFGGKKKISFLFYLRWFNSCLFDMKE